MQRLLTGRKNFHCFFIELWNFHLGAHYRAHYLSAKLNAKVKKKFFLTDLPSQILLQSVCQISPTRFFDQKAQKFYSNPTTSYLQCKSILSIPKQQPYTTLTSYQSSTFYAKDLHIDSNERTNSSRSRQKKVCRVFDPQIFLQSSLK